MAISKWDRQHVKNIDRLTKEIDKIYNTAIQRIAIIASSIRKEQLTDNIFKFSDHPITTEVVESVRNMMARELETAIVNGVRSEWTLSNNKNNEMCNMVFGGSQAVENKGYLRKYYNNNEDALVQFIQRKEAGMDLSSRVWNFVDKYQTELELALDNGIRQGMSAADMTKDLKECLKYPDKVFRRVRDEHGDLVLSKEAKAFHPGQGVYRSSYMNARRLAATETNMAYRTADYVRWQQLDFVVGIEIGLSNNHTCKGYKGKTPWMDICDELQGKYPKDFKWTGWHPHCRCHATPIMKTIAEMKADDERVMRGEEPSKDSVNSVNEMPKQFNDWLIDNQERIDRAKSKPYFIKDNKSIINRQMVAVLKP